MYNDEPVRIGLIGCGGMGLRHAVAALEMAEAGCRPVIIAALCDSDETRRAALAERIARQTGTAPLQFSEIERLLECKDIDAVDIVLPTFHHHTVILAALSAGKHVLVEKPMALTVKACDLVVEAAERSGLVVAIAENYRRIPGNRALKAAIDSGSLGPLNTMLVRTITSPALEMNVGDNHLKPPTWYRDKTRAGGYLVLEMGVHEADLQEFWFGNVESVAATTQVFGDSDDVSPVPNEDLFTAQLTFKSGFSSQLTFGSAMPGVEMADRILIGKETILHSNAWHAVQDGHIRHQDDRSETLESFTRRFVESLSTEKQKLWFPAGTLAGGSYLSSPTLPLTYGVGMALFDFSRAIRTKGTPEITPDLARRSVALCHAIEESAQLKRPVLLNDVLAGKIFASQQPLDAAIGLA